MGQAMSSGSTNVDVDRGGICGAHREGAGADEDLSESAGRANDDCAALDRMLDGGSHCKYVRGTSCQPTDSVASVGPRAVGETTGLARAQIHVSGKSRRIRRRLPRRLRGSERSAEVADSSMRSRRRRSDGYNPSQTHLDVAMSPCNICMFYRGPLGLKYLSV